MVMNKPKPIDILLDRVSRLQYSAPAMNRRCSRELRELLKDEDVFSIDAPNPKSPNPKSIMASASMPALHQSQSLTKRSSSGRLRSSGRLTRRTLSSKWSSSERGEYGRRRSSKNLPAPNAEFNTFDGPAHTTTTSPPLLVPNKIKKATTSSSSSRSSTIEIPQNAKTAKPEPAAESTTTSTSTARSASPLPARTNIPADASSISQRHRPSPPRQNRELRVAKANVKYNTEAGRAAVLAVCQTLHHDFGQLNSIINVTLPAHELDNLAEHPGVSWIDRSGAVYFMQPYRSSK